VVRLIATLIISLLTAVPALSADLIGKDRWNIMDQEFRMGYAAGVYDTAQLLGPETLNLRTLPGTTIVDDMTMLIQTANKCLEPLKSVGEVRHVVDDAFANRTNPKESAALITFIAFVGCADATQAASIDEATSNPRALFEWHDRWKKTDDQVKNGYVAGAADSIQYLAKMAPDLLELNLLEARVGPCGVPVLKSANKLKTIGDLSTFSEKAVDDAGEDVSRSAAGIIFDALQQCNR